MGWIGLCRQLEYALRVAGADRDEEGRFVVSGNIVSFLGLGDECVVPDDARYYVNGQPVSVAGLMNSTSYGSRVQVI